MLMHTEGRLCLIYGSSYKSRHGASGEESKPDKILPVFSI